jgi:hypothetical protein
MPRPVAMNLCALSGHKISVPTNNDALSHVAYVLQKYRPFRRHDVNTSSGGRA